MNNDYDEVYSEKEVGVIDLNLQVGTDLPDNPSVKPLMSVFQRECQIRPAKDGHLYIIRNLSGGSIELLIFEAS